jgi:cytoskeletal protein CcmA (bactofilin family)
MGMETDTARTEETTPQPRSSRNRGDQNTIINLGPRDELVGRLVYEGDLRVGGTFEGEATLSGDVSVDGDGTAKAKFEARNMAIRGNFEGEANVRERLLIAGSGTVSGTVRVSRLVIEDGALLNGNITMERPDAGLSPNGRPTEG